MNIGRIVLGICTAGISEIFRKTEGSKTTELNPKNVDVAVTEEPNSGNARLLREASQGILLQEAGPSGEVSEATATLNPDDFLREDEKQTRADHCNIDVLTALAEKITIRQEGIKLAKEADLGSVLLPDLQIYLPEVNFKRSIQDLNQATTLNELILHAENKSNLNMLLKAAAFAEISKYKEVHSGYNNGDTRTPEASYFYYPNNNTPTILKDTNFNQLANLLHSLKGDFARLAALTGKRKVVFE